MTDNLSLFDSIICHECCSKEKKRYRCREREDGSMRVCGDSRRTDGDDRRPGGGIDNKAITIYSLSSFCRFEADNDELLSIKQQTFERDDDEKMLCEQRRGTSYIVSSLKYSSRARLCVSLMFRNKCAIRWEPNWPRNTDDDDNYTYVYLVAAGARWSTENT